MWQGSQLDGDADVQKTHTASVLLLQRFAWEKKGQPGTAQPRQREHPRVILQNTVKLGIVSPRFASSPTAVCFCKTGTVQARRESCKTQVKGKASAHSRCTQPAPTTASRRGQLRAGCSRWIASSPEPETSAGRESTSNPTTTHKS